MPQDGVGYTPGTGVKIASREVTYSGEPMLAQAVGLVTFDGADDAKTVADVTADNPLPTQVVGELLEAINAMRFAVNQLTKTIGYALPNATGQPIMEARQATATNLNANVTIASGTVTTVTTCSTLTNQAQVGGINANDYIPALMHMQADNLRRNILVT
jgi:hypothetical protein